MTTIRPTGAAKTLTVLGVAVLSTSAAVAAGPSDPTRSVAATTPAPAATGAPIPTLPRPTDFVDRVSNRYLPLVPGSRWVYRGRTADGVEVIRVTALDRTKQIEGIAATVVHDRATLDGKLFEDTLDWYAQDRLGNVWYLGEDTTTYEPGKPPSHRGSWQAGVDGARAGFAMPAHTALGETYRQEFKADEAEDLGAVVDRSGRVHVAAGDFRRTLMTKDTTPLEPELIEYKVYAPGVGQVLELGTSPELETVQLVRFVKP